MAAALDVSRAPVRDALRQLVAEGLASAYPHRGAVVTPVSEDMVHDVFDVRARLEGLAARLAATRVTADELGRLEALIGAMEQSARSNEPGPQVEQDLEFHRTVLAASGARCCWPPWRPPAGRPGLLISITRREAPLDVVPGIHRPILEALPGATPTWPRRPPGPTWSTGARCSSSGFPDEHRSSSSADPGRARFVGTRNLGPVRRGRACARHAKQSRVAPGCSSRSQKRHPSWARVTTRSARPA